MFPQPHWALLLLTAILLENSPASARPPLDPRGKIHMPIGIANSVDALKTFVEPEGNFSPGFATYGIYFWVYDPATKKLYAPTMESVPCTYGLHVGGFLIPWSQWSAGPIQVRTQVSQFSVKSPAGPVQVVEACVGLVNKGRGAAKPRLYAALRPLGAAGGPVRCLQVHDQGYALLVDGHPALVVLKEPIAAGVISTDTIGQQALIGSLPTEKKARSEKGDCSGALIFDLEIEPGDIRFLDFVCPVLTGRRAIGHDWDGTSDWVQLDLAKPNPPVGGFLQPDPGMDFFRWWILPSTYFGAAKQYWIILLGATNLQTPNRRWNECYTALASHAALAMNEDAPDVAVINYNVFNRDGVYVANIFQKCGQYHLAVRAIDYFLKRPFNGRTQVEADNPGQVLWVMGEHWRFTRDRDWLKRIYPAAAKLAAMIRYYRTTPGPHYVKADRLEFGPNLPPDRRGERPALRRQILITGSCDGHHPEYTEAFDIAGLRAAALLARATGRNQEAAEWDRLAETLLHSYDKAFGRDLPRGYGNYSVLWPCRLYPFGRGKGHDQFRKNGATRPGGWRYFALAQAHQGLLAGNREAGYQTINNHLQHPQMAGWYVFDEGGDSGSGGWKYARTTWKGSVAMPHGWAIAEMFLLLRDCLLFEDEDRLVLLGGVPPAWFTDPAGFKLADMPTYFGTCSLQLQVSGNEAVLFLAGDVSPPGGFILRLPASLGARVFSRGKPMAPLSNGDFHLSQGTKEVRVVLPVKK